MCALLALLLSLHHSPVPCGLSSGCTNLFFDSLHFPLGTAPERSLSLCPAALLSFADPSLPVAKRGVKIATAQTQEFVAL